MCDGRNNRTIREIHLSICQAYREEQDKVIRVQGDITIPFPSVLCLIMGENTEKGLPRPLTLVTSGCLLRPAGNMIVISL